MKSEITGGYNSWNLHAMNIAVMPINWKSERAWTFLHYKKRSMRFTVAWIVSGSRRNSTCTTMSQLMRILRSSAVRTGCYSK